MSKNPFLKTPFPDFRNLDDLNKKEARNEAEQLREAINHHDHQYYVVNDPHISDRKYDELFERLQKLEKKFPDLQSDVSPTQKVGAEPLEKLSKKKHVAPMLSISSSAKQEEMEDFVPLCGKKQREKKRNFSWNPNSMAFR
jgi:DNA ligase (NAD+)